MATRSVSFDSTSSSQYQPLLHRNPNSDIEMRPRKIFADSNEALEAANANERKLSEKFIIRIDPESYIELPEIDLNQNIEYQILSEEAVELDAPPPDEEAPLRALPAVFYCRIKSVLCISHAILFSFGICAGLGISTALVRNCNSL